MATATAARVAEIQDEIRRRLAELHTARESRPETAAASARHESALIDVWSLRFELANLEMLDERDPSIRAGWQREALDASREIAEHEKRLRVARKARTEDKDEEADAHEREQDDLGAQLSVLAGGR